MMVRFALRSSSRMASPCRGTSQRICSWLAVMPCWASCMRASSMTPCVDPADERDLGIFGALQHGRRHGGGDATLLAHALFHHGAALADVGVHVADEDTVFVVLVGRDHVGIAGNAGNG